MRRVIVGTAGHIDHGKTRLVEALTGIDCDRWEEERRRGITIDLGFAHLERDGVRLGFIDVPGHERFLPNALAGLGGIRVMLLVVAADEGVEPQTLEHLEICSLLEIPRAVVALTKTDLVSGDLLELARLEVEELMAASPWGDARVVATSSITGEGVAELAEHLVELTRSLPEEDLSEAPTRLPIDRAFQLRGLGSIVTGTLVAGEIEQGRVLEVLPGGGRGKVRSVQVHGEERQRASWGERTAVQLAGVPLADLERGQQLAEPETLAGTTSLLVRLTLLPSAPAPLAGWVEVQVYVYSSEVIGKVRPVDADAAEPGETLLAELRLAAPIVAVRGDRFVVRRPSPAATLGGGEVLDPAWRRVSGAARRHAARAAAGDLETAVGHWVSQAGLAGLDAAELAPRLGRRPSEALETLSALEARAGLLAVDPGQGRGRRFVDPESFRRLEKRAAVLLASYLERERLAAGMPRAEVAERLLPGVPVDLVRVYFDWLEARQVLVQKSDLVDLPGREAELDDAESRLARRLESTYRESGLEPPPPAQVAETLGVKPQIVDGVVHYLVQKGALVKLGGGLVISAEALDRAREELRTSGLDDFTVSQFKEHFGLSRKWAIPILEHFDARRVTHRLGSLRKLAAEGEGGA